MKITVAQAIRVLEQKKAQLVREIAKAESETINQAKGYATALSSGPFTTKQLKELGHPYARRDPRARFPAVINDQTGRFRAAWFTSEYDGNGKLTHSLINADPVADFMKGTRKMIERPIVDQIAKMIEKDRMDRLQKAINKVMNT